MISVEGVVRERPSESINKKMKTGYIEVELLLLLCKIGLKFWFSELFLLSYLVWLLLLLSMCVRLLQRVFKYSML